MRSGYKPGAQWFGQNKPIAWFGPSIGKRFFTRASKTNREYILPHLRVEGNPDKVSMELALDAQTSGGLLVSLPKEEVALFIKAALANGAICAVEVGEVQAKGPHHLVFKP